VALRSTSEIIYANTTRYARNCAITVTNGYLLKSARGSPGYSSRCARYATSKRKAMIEPIVAKAIRSTSQPVHDGFSAIEVGAEGNGAGGGDGSTHGFSGDDKKLFLRYLNLHEKIASAPNPTRSAHKGSHFQASERNSYSSITAATATLPSGAPLSTRTTLPLQRTRMLSVKVISGGRVSVNSIGDPAVMAESK